MKIDTPNPGAAVINGGFSTQWVSFFTKVRNWIVANSQAGTTAQRPTTGRSIGDRYFDTDLGYPVWYDGTQWVDATGTAA